jgi:hypothetical protein
MLQERINPLSKKPEEKARPRDSAGRRALVLGSLGVVFGDIGTSPIYALREAVITSHSTAAPVVMGVLSMILWAVLISRSCRSMRLPAPSTTVSRRSMWSSWACRWRFELLMPCQPRPKAWRAVPR